MPGVADVPRSDRPCVCLVGGRLHRRIYPTGQSDWSYSAVELVGRVGVIEQLAQGGDGHEPPPARAAAGDPCPALLFQAVQLVGEFLIKLEGDVGDV